MSKELINKESVDNTNQKDWRVLEYFVPIQEKVIENGDLVIRGVAINETTTLNNVKYVAEELIKAAPTFRNVPILLDHKNEVKNIVGRTTENVVWDDMLKRINFEGRIMDKDIKEMIKDGRIGSVSIGAKVEDLTEEKDGSMKAIGIRGLEISLVAVPGDSHANLAQALKQSFHLKEMANVKVKGSDNTIELAKEDKKMTEEIKTEDSETETPEEKKEEVVAPVEDEVKTEEKASVSNINVKVDTSEISEMKKQISELKELLIEKKELKEKKVIEDKTKGVVSEKVDEKLDKINNMIVERAAQGLAMYRDYNKEDSDSKLKRLVR